MKNIHTKKVRISLIVLLVILLMTGLYSLYRYSTSQVVDNQLKGELVIMNCMNAGYPCAEKNIMVESESIMLSDPNNLISEADKGKTVVVDGHATNDQFGFKTFIVEKSQLQ